MRKELRAALELSWTLFWEGGLAVGGLVALIWAISLRRLIDGHWPSWSDVGIAVCIATLFISFISLVPFWLRLMLTPKVLIRALLRRLRRLRFWAT